MHGQQNIKKWAIFGAVPLLHSMSAITIPASVIWPYAL